MSGQAEFTIDELARNAGTTVRSLRVYHERGILPPPQVKGRTGYYGSEHLNRVQTISRLLDRGIKLNGIRELLEAWDRGDDLGDILGVTEAESAVVAGAETIAATELAERYRDIPNGLARVVAVGLYEPVDASAYRLADRQMVELLAELVAAGIRADEALAELERIAADADRVARRFVDVFRRTAGQQFQSSPRSAAEVSDFTHRVGMARVLPGRIAGEYVNRFVDRYLGQDTDLGE